jgi:hypothetical protein
MQSDPSVEQSSAPRPSSGWWRGLLLGIVLLLAIVVWFENSSDAGRACFDENTFCAFGGPPKLWLGRVYTRTGAPASFATVQYFFRSVFPPPVSVVADRRGRYCIRWPAESIEASASATLHGPGGVPDPATSRSPRPPAGR